MPARKQSLSVQIVGSVLFVFGLGVLTLFLAAQNAISITDNDALAREERQAAHRLAALIAAIPEQQRSSTVWDEALKNIDARDEQWLDANLGAWFQEYFGHDESYLLDAENTPIFASASGELRAPTFYSASADAIAPLVEQLRRQMKEASAGIENPFEELAEVAVVKPLWLRGKPAIVSLVPVISDTGDIAQAPGTEPLHVAVRYVDSQMAEEIGVPFELSDVAFVSDQPEGKRVGVPLTGPADDVLAWLSWTPKRPGMHLLRQLLPVILGVGLASGMLVLWIVRRLLRVSGQLEASEAQAREDLVALEKAREAAKVADQAKMNFMSMVSHELRTPLTVILGYARLGKNLREMPATRRLEDALRQEQVDLSIVEKCVGELLEFSTSGMGRIERSGDHLLFLVNQLLDLAKMETGRLEVEPEICNVKDVLEPVVDQMRVLTEQKGLGLKTDITSCSMLADVLRTRQILINLIGNAIKFTDAGEISVSVLPSPSKVHIEVADTGIGIEPGQLENIFEAFHQADPSSSRSAAGTGLGLALAKELARLEGGTLTVRSEMGVGSVFTLSLPRHSQQVLEQAA